MGAPASHSELPWSSIGFETGDPDRNFLEFSSGIPVKWNSAAYFHIVSGASPTTIL
jgi:hypothetical protein